MRLKFLAEYWQLLKKNSEHSETKNKIIHIKAPLMDLTAIRYNQGENMWKGIQIRRKDSE